MSRLPREQALSVYSRINEIDAENVEVASNERLHGSEFAAALRTFLKNQGFNQRQISVRVAHLTTFSCVDIHLPDAVYEDMPISELRALASEDRKLSYEAERNLARVIDAAFPSCADRSESMIDYFDFLYMIH